MRRSPPSGGKAAATASTLGGERLPHCARGLARRVRVGIGAAGPWRAPGEGVRVCGGLLSLPFNRGERQLWLFHGLPYLVASFAAHKFPRAVRSPGDKPETEVGGERSFLSRLGNSFLPFPPSPFFCCCFGLLFFPLFLFLLRD